MGINVTKLRHEPHYAVYLRKRTRRQRTRNSDNWLSAARRARLPRVTVIGGWQADGGNLSHGAARQTCHQVLPLVTGLPCSILGQIRRNARHNLPLATLANGWLARHRKP